ncbi:MAG: hypothetical protein QGG40_19585 [Myxococcota bacterium]|nr:hypothetical protein [Myxococcota bacterium]
MTFYVDWQDVDGPASLQVVLDGESIDLDLTWGEDTLGVFGITESVSDLSCSEYFFRWSTADGGSGTFPEGGSYLYGPDCADDHIWVNRQQFDDVEVEDEFEDWFYDGSDERRSGTWLGCTTSRRSGGAGAMGLVLLFVCLGQRRR